MSIARTIPSAPPGSALEMLFAATATIYARIEADQLAFLALATGCGPGLACPPGCGACCAPFVPDVLPVEAAYIAAWLLDREPALAVSTASWESAGPPAAPPCPFLISAPLGSRCSIYPARPMVCRLFGVAGVRDKEGRAAFRPCARMPMLGYPSADSSRRSLIGAELVRVFGAEPPIMSDYAAALAALSPSEAAERILLTEALPAAIRRVGLSHSLAEAARDRTYSKRDERETDGVSDGPEIAARGDSH